MLSSQALALKSSTGLPNFTCLEGESLILCYSTSFLQTPLAWPGGLSPCGCWFHVNHFTSLSGPGESFLLHISMGIYKQPKFPPAAQNGFSAGCNHCSLLCVSPGAAAACSQELWLQSAWYGVVRKADCIRFPYGHLLRWPAEQELSAVLFSAFAGWSHWHPIWPRLSSALPSRLWGRHYNTQEF